MYKLLLIIFINNKNSILVYYKGQKEEIEIKEKDKSILNENDLELLLEILEEQELLNRKKEFDQNKKELKEMGCFKEKCQRKKVKKMND